uniref:Uncharacterized protein n=1 Tax=Chromera velia CCMP2878 TaxID=1169474 RepID=A0A0G4G4B5_9ALVE|eukprot:Cvel_4151.t1-p1 / transcript=Cvel_4151.t1 / gene=Cvel_4151 / organism=Chromera_velia_CCMP2878 / gene_product=hypothetical protein / transcript_product=hypothetical protein / location=Cvel_scaffold178:33191-33622(+) / protein_length=99 / sequence_SO=supercontig / SO=protein_coding / is_pseudo=false
MQRANLTDDEKVDRLVKCLKEKKDMELIQVWFTNLLEAEVSIWRVEGHGGDFPIGEDDDEEEEEADGDSTGSGAVVLVDDLPPETIFMARDEMPKVGRP